MRGQEVVEFDGGHCVQRCGSKIKQTFKPSKSLLNILAHLINNIPLSPSFLADCLFKLNEC